MKQYSLLIGLATVFLYSMHKESENIYFDTIPLVENTFVSLNEKRENSHSFNKQESAVYYTYDTTINHTPGYVEDVAWHPTEKNKLITISNQNVSVWNTQKNESPIVRIFSEDITPELQCMAVSDDGNRLVCAGNNKLFTWNFLKNERLKKHIVGGYYDFIESQLVKKVLFIPNQNALTVSLFEGNTSKLWPNKNIITFKNVETNESDTMHVKSGRYIDMIINPLSAHTLMTTRQENACLETTFDIFDIEKKQLIRTVACDIFKIACNPTNEFTMATSGWWHSYVMLWDQRKKGLKTDHLEVTGCWWYEHPGLSLHWLADGHTLVVSSEKRTQLFDIRTGGCIQALPNVSNFFHTMNCCAKETGKHTEDIVATRLHPQEHTLLTFGKNSIKVWQNLK